METIFTDTSDIMACMQTAYIELDKQAPNSTPKVMLLGYDLYQRFIYEMYKKHFNSGNPYDPHFMTAKVRECGRMDKNTIEVY